MKQAYSYILLSVFLGVAGVASISFFYSNSVAVTVLLALLSGIALFFWNDSEDIFFFTSGFVIGPIAEIVCIYFGAWSYASPDLLGIPMWLPLAWGKVVLVMERSYHIKEHLFE